MQFQQLFNGLCVGYHVEGCDTFELSGAIPLSMKTLHNDRQLYLSNNVSDWRSDHLPEGTMQMYEIHFIPPKQMVYVHSPDYDSVNPRWSETKKIYIRSTKLKKLIAQGYRLFSLAENNDKDELPESFIINPTHYVKKILKISKS